MHRFAAAAALCLLATPSFAQMVTISPEQIGEIFCIAREGNDMTPVEGLLTAELKSAIAEAEAKNDTIQKATPDEKPPLGDGIPWQAFPDYADTCTPGAVTLTPGEASVAIDYAFKDYPDANFSDSLMLKQVDDPATGASFWRIDNLAYATEGDLRTVLSSVFEN
ncbi:hypothetical protein PRN20_18445 [Devosia sp. ZB163]|uniref:hypothetical protein n=1 Tax=Devosia sp. ZB163 TaxID=3025938 RepID=UPI00235FE27D|nr:hypothetical protein [Devosia sp. ZB163]MDC9825718.1 hypothetical protein [Devosia sp. ZB163]